MSLKNIIRSLPGLIWWKDKNYKYLGCNKNFSDFLELSSADEIIGKTDNVLAWQEVTLEKLREKESQVLATKESHKDIVLILWKKNKQPITIRTDFIPFFSDNGKIIGVLGHAVKVDNDELMHNIFFTHMLENLPYYIFWKDTNSVYLGCNQNFARLIGMNPAKIVGKTDHDLNWNMGEADLYIQSDKMVIKGKKQVNAEETLIRPDGSKLIMLVSKTPVYNIDNHVLGVLGVLGISVDITHVKRVEEELRHTKEELEILAEEANHAKANFLDNMRHDIRTPLANIVGAAQLLKNKESEGENLVFIDGIISSAQSLLDFLTNLLKFNNLNSGNEPVRLKKFALKEVIDKLSSTMNLSAIQKKLDFKVDYDENLPYLIIGDEFRVYLILLNLLSNAFKFTDKGFIKLIVKLEKFSIRQVIISFTIQDSGAGIEPKNHEKIFERFGRLSPSYIGIHKGEGLGLHIVKQFIDELDGDIEVESEVNKGSTFRCILSFKIPLLDTDL